MENLYTVNEYEDYGEYCYIVKANSIDEALSYFIEYKRSEGVAGYELKNNNKYIEGIIRDDHGLTVTSFRLSPLEFGASNVIFMGGYSE